VSEPLCVAIGNASNGNKRQVQGATKLADVVKNTRHKLAKNMFTALLMKSSGTDINIILGP
jgi:hypothetical protein